MSIPNHPMVAYDALARRCGIDRLFLVLSFDCDTDQDAEAALELAPWLDRLGVKATYAVPGAQLRRQAVAYRRLAEDGRAFLNHGDRPHAEWRETRYYGMTFYHQLTTAEIVADMRAGDQAVREVLGRTPTGFRAPHFGCFQAPEQLALIHDTARALGYRLCSNTIPDFALTRGPFFAAGGVLEVPLFGSYRYPSTLLDSWTYLSNYETYTLKDEYDELFAETVDRMTADGLAGLLCYYVDPAHVRGQAPFERAMARIAQRGIPSLNFDDVANLAVGVLSP